MITDQQEKELEKNQVFQWVAIKALVVDEGKILLGKRLDEDDFGLYEIPGGKLEVGESLNQTLRREVLEETGVEVEPIDLEESEGRPLFVVQTKNKRRVTMVVLAKVVNKEGMFSKMEELDEIRFYSKQEVSNLLEKNLIRIVFKGLMKKFAEGGI